jgi:hypothetical protein
MKIDARWTDHGYGPDGSTRLREPSTFSKDFFLTFQRPHNGTKVLMIEIPPPPRNKEKYGDIQLLPWSGEFQMKQLCDHDSCWSTSGFDWVFQSFVQAWDFFEEQGLEPADTRKIDPSFHYSLFNGHPQYWLIKKLELVDPKDRWGSDYIIEFDRRIGLEEVSKFMTDVQTN